MVARPTRTHQLVGLAQEGDRQALNALLDHTLPRILRLVRMKRGAFLAQRLADDDLTQEVLIRVWRSLDQYDPDQTASFLLWVARLAENALRDLARRQRARKRNPGALLSLEDECERGLPEASAYPVVTATPSRLLSRLEAHQILDRCVAALSQEAKDLLMLRFYCDLPLEEVGRGLRLSPEATRSRIRRALARLRLVLEERGIDGAADPGELLRKSF